MGFSILEIDAPIFEYASDTETWIHLREHSRKGRHLAVKVEGIPVFPDGTPIGDEVSADDKAVVEVIDELPAAGIAPIEMGPSGAACSTRGH